MVAKCANPDCSATYRYLHEGKLFVFETKPEAPLPESPIDPDYAGRSQTPQYFWLCSSCCCAMTLQPDEDHGATVVRKQPAPRNVFVMQGHKAHTRAA
jgi:hypothetical protein